MRSALSLTIIALATAIAIFPRPAEGAERSVVITENADYFGFDLRSEKDVSLNQCQQLCLNDDQCRAFSYNTKVKWCFLKSDFGRIVSVQGAVAGKMVVNSGEPDLGAPTALEFVPTGYLDEAGRFVTDIKNLPLDSTILSDESLSDSIQEALSRNDRKAARTLFQQALKRTAGDSSSWTRLSFAASRWLRGSGNRDHQLQKLSLSAAIIAYQTSRTQTPRAAALTALAEALVQNSNFGEAIKAYRISLEIKVNDDVQQAYVRLRKEKGFRVVNHVVEADNQTLRVCIDFSDDLAETSINYEDYVSMKSGNRSPLTTHGRRLCVEGLDHGSEYQVLVRQGLPSADGERLEEPVVLNTYIRDRAPTIRFTGDKFVLANSARHGIPIVGINTDSAELELFRVGERSLSRIISGSQFLKQLSRYDTQNIKNNLGQSVWKGSMSLVKKRNREAITSFPIDEALPDRKPGIYILTAKATGVEQDSWSPAATQWFVISDIGLVSYAGNDGLSVFASSLDTGRPIAQVSLNLLSRNNEILGTARTDENGKARFDPGLMRGTAGLASTVITASLQQASTSDFVFLDLTRAGFDLSDRGVEGRPAPGPLDAYTYLDRGIYRPGETVNIVSLLRNHTVEAIMELPLTLVVTRPDNVEAARTISREPLLGGHEGTFNIPDNAMRGVWNVQVFADPNSTPISEKPFLVEDFQPDRIEFDLTAEAEVISPLKPTHINLEGRYLYGAPAENLLLEGEYRLKPVRKRPEAVGYQFGLADESLRGDTVESLENLPKTDPSGKAGFDVQLDHVPVTTRPLIAEINVRMKETGGRAVERNLKIPVKPSGPMIGIRPEFKDGQVAEGSIAGFKMIALDASGGRIDLSRLNWSLFRMERNYQWYTTGSNWRYEAVDVPRMIESGQINAKTNEEIDMSFPVDWGRYRLEIEGPNADGPATSVLFNAGWFVDSTSTETPDALEIALNQPSYKTGSIARLNVSARHAGELLIAVGADRVLEAFRVHLKAGDNEVKLNVRETWGAGVYVTATLFKPGEAVQSRLPSRAIGTTWLAIDPQDRALSVTLQLPPKIIPDTLLDIPVSVTGLEPGEEAFVTLSAVDVGVLNLTQYQPPNPSQWYFGQRQLGLEIRDLYGRLIDSSQGSFGRVRFGGDGPGLTAQGSPPTEELLSLYSGMIRLDGSGKANIAMHIPQFNGTARFMAVVWSQKGVGQAHQDLIIRDPVVVSASLPKILAPGDMAQSVLEIFNSDGEAGTYQLKITSDDLVEVADIPETLTLGIKERRFMKLSMTALTPGATSVAFELSHEGETVSQVSRSIVIRPATMPVATRSEFSLAANGGSVAITSELLSDSHLAGAEVCINVSQNKSLDISSLLMRLDRYPYGCAEQTVSRALPLLYLSDLNAPESLIGTDDLNKRIEDAIIRVGGFQSAGGGFGLWGPGSGNLWLDSYISDFLTRAREKGHFVPEQIMRLAVQNLQNSIAYQDKIADSGNAIAYGLYVLARNRMASVADLRYYADTKLEEFKTPLARAHLASALSLYNEQQRSKSTFASAMDLATRSLSVNYKNDYYGSLLRDGAAMLSLVAETPSLAASTSQLIDFIDSEIGYRTFTSTQEDAWLVLAARAVEEADRSLQLSVNGHLTWGALHRKISGEALIDNPMMIVNQAEHPVEVVVTKYASPLNPYPAAGHGFSIKRQYYRLDGTEATLTNARQNERFVVVLTVSEFNRYASQILVSDLLPGGFEIDNPNLVKSAQLENFSWLGETRASHVEFRNDRFVAAFKRGSSEPRTFNFAYVVRAVTPGRFSHPAASVEDMYRPENFARTSTGFLEIQPAN